MRQFKDKTGHTWELDFNLSVARKLDEADWTALIGEEMTVSFLNIHKMSDKLFQTLLMDTGCLAFIAWVMVQGQKGELTEDGFCERLDGQALSDLKEAVWEELLDFFPEKRTALSTLIRTYRLANQKIEDHLKEKKEEYDDAFTSILDQSLGELDKSLEKIAGTGPQSGPPAGQ